MSTPEGGASQQDIDLAVKVVELAGAEGQIVDADRDLRISQLKSVQTKAEIDVVLGSLRQRLPPPVPEPPSVPATADLTSPLSAAGRTRSLPFVPLLGGLVTVVAAIVGVVFLVNLLSGVDLDSAPSGSPPPGSQPSPTPADVLSATGFRALLAAIQAQTGTTDVFDATLYPGYASVQLPVDRETRRQAYYYWDGVTLKESNSFGRSSNPRIDLATIDVATMQRLVRLARRQVEEPISWYVIVRAPDASDQAVLYAYASNKFSEGGYVSADARGKVVRKVTW